MRFRDHLFKWVQWDSFCIISWTFIFSLICSDPSLLQSYSPKCNMSVKCLFAISSSVCALKLITDYPVTLWHIIHRLTRSSSQMGLLFASRKKKRKKKSMHLRYLGSCFFPSVAVHTLIWWLYIESYPKKQQLLNCWSKRCCKNIFYKKCIYINHKNAY